MTKLEIGSLPEGRYHVYNFQLNDAGELTLRSDGFMTAVDVTILFQ